MLGTDVGELTKCVRCTRPTHPPNIKIKKMHILVPEEQVSSSVDKAPDTGK